MPPRRRAPRPPPPTPMNSTAWSSPASAPACSRRWPQAQFRRDHRRGHRRGRGQFPSTNVAEAISVLPGVTIDKAFGQGEKILGTDPALNRTLLNGQAVVGRRSSPTSRVAPSTFAAGALAGQQGRGLSPRGAHRRRRDRRHGDRAHAQAARPRQTIAGHVGYLIDRIEGGDPQASLLFGWKNDADTFGVIVSAQRADEGIRATSVLGTVTGRDYAVGVGGGGSLTRRWTGARRPGAALVPGHVRYAGTINAIAQLISAHYFGQRARDTISLAIQFKPHEKMTSGSTRSTSRRLRQHQPLDVRVQQQRLEQLMRLTDLEVEGGVSPRLLQQR